MLPFGVGRVGGLRRGVDGIAEDLDDGLRVLVFEAGNMAKAGAAAVEAEGGDGGDCDEEEEERYDGCGGMHRHVIGRRGLKISERESQNLWYRVYLSGTCFKKESLGSVLLFCSYSSTCCLASSRCLKYVGKEKPRVKKGRDRPSS